MRPVLYRAIQTDDFLEAYRRESDLTDNLVELLTDAMNWCSLNDLEFDEQLHVARIQFQTECM